MNAFEKFQAQCRMAPTQIPKAKFKAARKFLLENWQRDAAEKHSIPLDVTMGLEQTLRGFGIPRNQTELFLTNLKKEGLIVPHPLGGWMLKGQTCPDLATAEEIVKQKLKKLGTIS